MPAFDRLFQLGVLTALLTSAPSALATGDQHPFVASADREYSAIFSHPDNPCKDSSTTISYETCIGREVTFTETHLNALLTAIRGIAAEDDQAPPPSQAYGPRHELALLNQADTAWRTYRKNICGLAYAGFAGGSGAPSAEAECEYRTDREYAKQLSDAVELSILAK